MEHRKHEDHKHRHGHADHVHDHHGHAYGHHRAPPAPTADKLFTDSVCGMKVAANSEKTLEHGGHSYHFCSARCMEKFRADPQTYLQPKDNTQAAATGPEGTIYTCPMPSAAPQRSSPLSRLFIFGCCIAEAGLTLRLETPSGYGLQVWRCNVNAQVVPHTAPDYGSRIG